MHNLLPAQPLSDEIDDDALIVRIVARDCDAFALLFDRYAGKALGFATRILGDQALAEDVIQEAFWRVWQRAGSFDPAHASLSTWLMGIVHHCAIDALRRQRCRITPVEIEDADHELRLTHDESADVAECAWLRMAGEQVRKALAQLPAAQRVVIELAFFAGFSRQEIAERLNEPLGTVHTRARLGMSKLKDMLAPLA
jgi:RNA polymerase sigma-70 factor (ECF subfamily)